MNRFRTRCLAAAIALLASGCAATLSDQDVTTVVTQEAASPAAPVDDLGVAMLRDNFVAKAAGSTVQAFGAAEANDHVRTLFPALLEAIPRVFSSNGIHAVPIATEQASGADILAAARRHDYALLISPHSSSGPKGMAPTSLTLNAQIIDRNHVTVWRGQVILRTDHVSSHDSPIYRWSAAMADDAARTLLARLGKEAIVRTGPAVAQAIDPSAFQGAERKVFMPPAPPEPEPDVPAALAAVQIHSPAGDVPLLARVDEIRAALPAAPAPQITLDRMQTLWDQKDGIIFHLVDGKATAIDYSPQSKASIPALGLQIGDGIKDFEAKLGHGKDWGPRSRVWPLDAHRELAASFGDNGKVNGLSLRGRIKARAQ